MAKVQIKSEKHTSIEVFFINEQHDQFDEDNN